MYDPTSRLNAALSGRYVVERELGQGGMATVYLARDVRHERRVALKVLKPELAAVVGAERFLAEIRTTANLQHPHILPLHDSGEADGLLFYVMPHVEGESLRDRLDREGQLPVPEAVAIAVSVGEALAYAHGRGVIHRDIKPANILLHAGEPLISDFGIALAVSAGGSARLTETGLSVGTPHYMSPEQATGDQPLGPPSDVYALGCVLYEMLLGEPPHVGRTAQAVLGKIITSVPTPPVEGRPSVPAHVDAAVRRALEKVPADRFATAHDFARALVDPGFRHGARDAAGAAEASSTWRRATMALGAALAVSLVALVTTWSAGRAARPLPVVRSAFNLQPGDELSERNSFAPSLAVSPDGTHVVYVGRRDGVQQLFDRPIGSDAGRPLAGTEGGHSPFFSPDGRWVGFFADGLLEKVPLSGGLPVGVAPAAVSHGGVWADTDTIYFSLHGSSIWKVSAQGGTPEIVTTHDSIGGIVDDSHPDALPGGRAILFARNTNQPASSWISVRDLETGEQHDLVNGWTPRYVPSGHIVYSRGGSLWAVGFDARRLQAIGEPGELLDGLWSTGDGGDPFAVSPAGMLVFVREPEGAASEVVRVDATGAPTSLFTAGDVSMPRVSPDGTRVAVWIDADLWVVDLARLTRTRLTHSQAGATPFAWTPDSRFLTYYNPESGIERIVADGSSGPEPLLPGPPPRFPTSWSPDGRVVALYETNARTQRDLWTWALDTPEPAPFLVTQFQERMPRFSADGRWLAYVSDESGRDEIYLRPRSGPEGKITISVDGGTEPTWSPDGRRLFYRSGPRMMVVDVTLEPRMSVSAPRLVFENDRYVLDASAARALSNYDVLPDGGFVMILRGGNPTSIQVVQGWLQELVTLLPGG